MLFTEFRFLIFFVVAFTVYWALRWNGARKWWLLVNSYVFYAGWDWRFLGLLMFSTGIDFVVANIMAARPTQAEKRPWLVASLVAQLALLGFFKYYNFFVESAAAFSTWLGLPVEPQVLSIVLPVGISFYTFQSMSYTIDVYRGELPATKSLLDFALFVAFFPQLVAGPIVRASQFLHQLADKKRFADVDARAALALFLIGYVKKACISDHIAAVVDPIFGDPAAYGSFDLWLGVTLYAIQIYCDFSGYSDMAIATAALLGYRLVLNFDAPYLSLSIREFWRRWHISLSTWFRDYLFVPLGGSRGSSARTGFNLLMVFFLCGLWHGASWNFVLFGLFHGTFLVIERGVPVERLPRALGHAYCWLVHLTGWAIFRPQGMDASASFLAGMFGLPRDASAAPGLPIDPRWWLLPIGFMAIQALRVRAGLDERAADRVQPALFALAYGAAVALVLPWAAAEYTPFIYFQF
jgi:alginate O-acetyltransferase complex protein AlgI